MKTTHLRVPIPPFDAVYEVSEDGEIRRYRAGNSHNAFVGRVLTQFIDSDGYRVAWLCNAGSQRMLKVHRLVALAFIPNPENKPQVNHRDGNKANNHYTNLEWVTPTENQRHADRTGLRDIHGTRNPNAKLTPERVRKLRDEYQRGVGRKALSEKYGVTLETVWSVATRKTWKHVT